jgi:Protein of unknown function (DUF2924)
MRLVLCKQDGLSSARAKFPQRGNGERMDETKRRQKALMWHEIEGLRHQTVRELKIKYREVCGQESRSNHKQFLVRRIAWRLQANAEGDLSERARHRALALAEEAELRIRAPASFLRKLSEGNHRDSRLPPPGTRITRRFQHKSVSVEVLDKGFRYEERVYKSLSAVARHITGTQWNGFLFFGLQRSAEGRHGR